MDDLKIYFDTEFTHFGIDSEPELISIGAIAETGETFYAEIIDYDKNLCSEFVKTTVIPNLYLQKNPNKKNCLITDINGNYEVKGDGAHVMQYFSKKWLQNLIERYNCTSINLISDCCAYDFYLLCRYFLKYYKTLPNKLVPYCHDICGDLESSMGLTQREAFDISRENVVKMLHQKLPKGKKHNALYDAKVIKIISENI